MFFASVPWAPLEQSDHNMIFLIPVNRCKSKCVTPIKRNVKKWSADEIEMLMD